MKIKRDPMDELFSKLIRTRDRWTCQRCGKYFPEGHRQGLHCSHFFSRRHRGTRWDEDNACAHCHGCHQYLGGEPVIFAEWVRNRLGAQRYDQLRVRAMGITKFTAWDLANIKAQMRLRLEQLEQEAA